MISREELAQWLDTLPHGALVGIDEGGLTLVEVLPDMTAGNYYEIGGLPEELEA